jgi:hypothetical protein
MTPAGYQEVRNVWDHPNHLPAGDSRNGETPSRRNRIGSRPASLEDSSTLETDIQATTGLVIRRYAVMPQSPNLPHLVAHEVDLACKILPLVSIAHISTGRATNQNSLHGQNGELTSGICSSNHPLVPAWPRLDRAERPGQKR